MFRNVRARPAAIKRRRMTPIVHRSGRWACILMFALTTGCAKNPGSPYRGPDPTRPSAGVAGVSYRSAVAPYVRQRPVVPAPWLRQNEQVAPASKPQR